MRARNVGFVALVMAPLCLCWQVSEWTLTGLVLAFAAACLLARFDGALRQHLTERSTLRHALALLLGASCAWFLLHESLAARWWIIDDHEIADALTVGRTNTLKGLWNTLTSHREIGSPPWSYPRYRPIYYTLRYLETYVWGFRPWCWYLTRIVILGVSFALSWLSLFALLGPAQASLTLLYALTAPYWVDVFGRLGPSEQYALLGCALFVYGASALLSDLYRERALRNGHWLIAVLGSVLASGSKENFVFVPGLLALLIALAAVRRRLSKEAALAGAAALLFAGWVMLVVVISVRRHGATIYGHEASLSKGPLHALKALKWLWRSAHPLVALALGLGLALPRPAAGRARRLLALGVGLLLCTAVYAVQVVVYEGRVAQESRYNFPSALISVLMVSVAVAWLRWEVLRSAYSARARLALDCALLGTAAVMITTAGFATLREGIAGNVERTRRFSATLERAQARARSEPKRPLLFTVADSENGFEQLVSLRIYFDYYGVTNPAFVSLPVDTQQAAGAMFRAWSTSGLREWEYDEGLRGGRAPHGKFLPLRDLARWGPPFGVSVSAPLPAGVTPLDPGF